MFRGLSVFILSSEDWVPMGHGKKFGFAVQSEKVRYNRVESEEGKTTETQSLASFARGSLGE